MSKMEGVKLTFETAQGVSSWESPYFDTSFEKILEGFVGMCISQGWQPCTVIDNMREFTESRDFWIDKKQ